MRSLFSALALGLLLAAPVAAGDDGLTGNWKFNLFQGGQLDPFWLLRLDSKDAKLTASAEPFKGAPKLKLDEIKLVGDTFVMEIPRHHPHRAGPARNPRRIRRQAPQTRRQENLWLRQARHRPHDAVGAGSHHGQDRV